MSRGHEGLGSQAYYLYVEKARPEAQHGQARKERGHYTLGDMELNVDEKNGRVKEEGRFK
jgi:hypothetical protein